MDPDSQPVQDQLNQPPSQETAPASGSEGVSALGPQPVGQPQQVGQAREAETEPRKRFTLKNVLICLAISVGVTFSFLVSLYILAFVYAFALVFTTATGGLDALDLFVAFIEYWFILLTVVVVLVFTLVFIWYFKLNAKKFSTLVKAFLIGLVAVFFVTTVTFSVFHEAIRNNRMQRLYDGMRDRASQSNAESYKQKYNEVKADGSYQLIYSGNLACYEKNASLKELYVNIAEYDSDPDYSFTVYCFGASSSSVSLGYVDRRAEKMDSLPSEAVLLSTSGKVSIYEHFHHGEHLHGYGEVPLRDFHDIYMKIDENYYKLI